VCGSDDDRYGHAQTPSPRVIDELTAPDRAAVHGEEVPSLRSTPARLKDLLRPAASLDRQVKAYIRYPNLTADILACRGREVIFPLFQNHSPPETYPNLQMTGQLSNRFSQGDRLSRGY
jgi:hypothetical protein